MNSMVFHPGLVLIATGFIAAIVPKSVRKFVLAGGPLVALAAMFSLSYGAEWIVPFINGIDLHVVQVDRLNWVFGLIFSMMAAIGGIYSMHNKSWMEALASMCYAGGALGVTLCGDWMTLIFFWELMAASSLFLIWCNNTAKSRKAGFRYLLVHMFGGNMLLAGIFLKVSAGEMMVSSLASGPHDLAFWLILIGVAVNAAIPPIHGWLVDAYPEGTITGSVFLSSFTTKVAVYCLIRIFAGTEFLMWVGVIMALYGACFAIIENDMRRLLAYHIVSQVGFMVAGVGIGTDLALNGATAHAFSHILYKSLLFMCAGAVIYATGIRKINHLGGLAKKMPFVFVCFVIAAFSISGIPLFNGFISKSITITAAMEAGFPAIELLLQLASVGTFLSITMKMIYFIFLREGKEVEIKNEIPKNMYVAMGVGATLCTVYGIFPDLLYRFLPFAMEYHPFTVDHIVQYIQLLCVAMVPFMMYLSHMEPHEQLTLDTDWLYRKPFVALVVSISSLVCATRAALGGFFRWIYDAFNELMANPMQFLCQEPRAMEGTGDIPDKYNPDSYRAAIGEPMVIIMAVFLVAVAFIAFA